MRPLTWLFLCFLLIPLGEIYLLIQIGEVIGAGWTIVGVVATAVIGAWMVKLQGLFTIQKATGSIRSGELPALELVEGLFLLVAGALLITPGFVTDAIGFLCLTPNVRRPVAKLILARMVVYIKAKESAFGSETFEAKYREIKDK